MIKTGITMNGPSIIANGEITIDAIIPNNQPRIKHIIDQTISASCFRSKLVILGIA